MNALNKNAAVELLWNDRQCSLMIELLVRKPFIEVFELIGKLNQKSELNSLGFRNVKLGTQELRVCLDALRSSQGKEYWEFALDFRDQLKVCGVLGEDCG